MSTRPVRTPIPSRAHAAATGSRRLVPAALGMLLAVLLAAAIAGMVHGVGHGLTSPAPVPIDGRFALVGPDGHAITDAAFRGRWMVVYFGYTHCPDTCPVAMNDIGSALDMLGKQAARVAPIFISVDPAHDDMRTVAAFTGRFDRRIVGLTGSPAQVAAAERSFRVAAEPGPTEDGRMTMQHSSAFVIIDPEGRFAGILDGGAAPEAIAGRLRQLGA